MAPISLAVLVRTVAGKLINIPLASLRRKLVDHNLFNFHEKSLQEMGFDRLLTGGPSSLNRFSIPSINGVTVTSLKGRPCGVICHMQLATHHPT